jgi:hypothetical protein
VMALLSGGGVYGVRDPPRSRACARVRHDGT